MGGYRMKQRIWELDVARGVCLIFMFYCHFVYDLTVLFQFTTINDGGLFQWTTNYTGILFITISGICATLGKHPIKRGLTVLGGGMIVSLVTYGMYLLGFNPDGFSGHLYEGSCTGRICRYPSSFAFRYLPQGFRHL